MIHVGRIIICMFGNCCFQTDTAIFRSVILHHNETCWWNSSRGNSTQYSDPHFDLDSAMCFVVMGSSYTIEWSQIYDIHIKMWSWNKYHLFERVLMHPPTPQKKTHPRGFMRLGIVFIQAALRQRVLVEAPLSINLRPLEDRLLSAAIACCLWLKVGWPSTRAIKNMLV